MLNKEWVFKYMNDLSFFYRSTDRGGGWKRHHVHDGFEVLLIESGHGTILIGDYKAVINPGTLVLIPPFVPHKIVMEEAVPYIRSMFLINPYKMNSLLEGMPHQQKLFKRLCHEQLKAYVLLMGEEKEFYNNFLGMVKDVIFRTHPSMKDSVICSSFIQLLALLEPRVDFTHVHHNKTIIAGVQNYISQHLSQVMTLDEIAGSIGVSKYHLAHEFSQTMGVTLMSYIANKKLALACDRLGHTDDEISQIAYELGFNDGSYFSKWFKRLKGLSPTQYRQSIKNR